MDTEVTISERRIDWLTCTARTGDRADTLETLGLAILDSAREFGDKIGPMGFQGYGGLASRHTFVGRRGDGVCVRLGGESASDYYVDVLSESDHCSRVDLCVTAYDATANITPADDIWRVAELDDPDSPSLPTVTRTQKRWGGYTTYVGSRASPIMARVYDKHAQSKGEYLNGSWRWELELKGHAAEQEAAYLMGDPKRESRAPAVIAEQFERWGLLVPWDASTDIELWRTPPRNSDLDQTARHLGRQYSKTAKRYVARYGIREFLALFSLDDDSLNGVNAK